MKLTKKEKDSIHKNVQTIINGSDATGLDGLYITATICKAIADERKRCADIIRQFGSTTSNTEALALFYRIESLILVGDDK